MHSNKLSLYEGLKEFADSHTPEFPITATMISNDVKGVRRAIDYRLNEIADDPTLLTQVSSKLLIKAITSQLFLTFLYGCAQNAAKGVIISNAIKEYRADKKRRREERDSTFFVQSWAKPSEGGGNRRGHIKTGATTSSRTGDDIDDATESAELAGSFPAPWFPTLSASSLTSCNLVQSAPAPSVNPRDIVTKLIGQGEAVLRVLRQRV